MSKRPYYQVSVDSDMGDNHLFDRWSDEWLDWLSIDSRPEEIAGALRDIAEHLGWTDEQE